MNNVIAIIKKEMRMYFNSPIAYVFIIIFLGLNTFLFFTDFFAFGQATIRPLFEYLSWLLIFLMPALTMRLWSEERNLGTIEMLMTLPLRPAEVALGKFFASVLLLLLCLILTLGIPITVGLLGPLDPGPAIGGYVGALLMGAAYLSVGIFISSLTENQIVALLVGIIACLALFLIGKPWVTALFPPGWVPFLESLGTGTHYTSIQRGVIDGRDLLYYISLIVFFLLLNVGTLHARKWGTGF